MRVLLGTPAAAKYTSLIILQLQTLQWFRFVDAEREVKAMAAEDAAGGTQAEGGATPARGGRATG